MNLESWMFGFLLQLREKAWFDSSPRSHGAFAAPHPAHPLSPWNPLMSIPTKGLLIHFACHRISGSKSFDTEYVNPSRYCLALTDFDEHFGFVVLMRQFSLYSIDLADYVS